jgi:DHA3 family macrolide efflux protein-like MFS transporter
MAITGFMLPIANGPVHALLQAIVAPAMHGRVFTLMGSFSSAMSPLGLLIAGPVADRLGVTTWFLIGGANCLIMTVIGFSVPAILHLDDRARHRTNESPVDVMQVVGATEAVAE